MGSPRVGVRWALAAPAVVLALLLAGQLAKRVSFPWDQYIWSESPFMTDMLKLTSGRPVYTNVSEANSMIYSPGLAYLTYGILRPFGLQTDVRYCRVVCIAIGMAAAACAAVFFGWIRRATDAEQTTDTRGRLWGLFAMCSGLLFVFKNHTSDTCHPDNLYILHAVATLLFTHRAATSGRYGHALAAVGVAAVGILAKQTAILGVGGAGLLLLLAHGRRWGLARVGGLAAFGAVVAGCAAWPLVRNANSRFFAFDVLSRHPLDFRQAKTLFAHDVLGVPHRVLLLLLFPPILFFLAFHSTPPVRRLVRSWAMIGGAEVLLSLASYFKLLGTSNSLFVLDLWAGLLVVPFLWSTATATSTGSRNDGLVRSGAAGLLVALTLALVPTKLAPSPENRKTMEELDSAVAADVRANRKALLSSGVMPLVHAGSFEPPMDRSACNWEMDWAQLGHLAGTNARIREKYYDVIYLHASLYGAETMRLIEENYQETRFIPGDNLPLHPDEFMFGFQGFQHAPVRVFEVKRNPL